MSAPARPRLALAMASVLWLPLAIGALVGWVADRSMVGALILWAEPLWVVLLVYGLLSLLLKRRWLLAAAGLVGATGGLAAMHLPPSPTPPPAQRPEWSAELRACAADPQPIERPIDLVQWSLADGARPDPLVITDLASAGDMFVLHGTATPEAGTLLAQVVEGEARFYPPSERGEGGMTLVVRGGFQFCGGTEDAWALSLPAAQGHSARAVVTFPRIEGAGVFPLIAVRLDAAHGPASWLGWPARLDGSAQRLAAVAQAIDPTRVVLAGDFGVPPSFRHLAGRLQGAGLAELSLPPSWPVRVGPLPFLPVHRLDRVWTGRGWVLGGTRVLDSVGQARAPVVSRLTPDVMTAR